jgi:hypothetical protein
LALTVFPIGCVAGDRGDNLGATSATEGNGEGGAEDGETGGDGDSGIRFDTPDGMGTAGDGGEEGCSKVDFLFVIDNSASMQRNQDELIGSFPGFIAAIRDTVEAQDYQIMVVDSDSTGDCTCGPWTELAQYCDEMVLEGCENHCTNVCPFDGTDCANVLGAGVDSSSPESGASSCGFVGGNRYIVDGQPDLDEAFACAASVGTQGDWNERPMGGMVRALDAERLGSGGCNEGFLRHDAILVVTIVTDAGPNTASIEHSRGTAAQWRQALLDAKHGNEEAIVVVGFMGDRDLPSGVCIQPDQTAPEYRKFVTSFGPRGFLGSACDAHYSPLFEQAVSTIDTTCDDFEPEG